VWTAAFVFTCALDALGRGAATFPPVKFVSQPPPGVSRLAQGYVEPGAREIVLVTSTDAFKHARETGCHDPDPIREIASVLVHEEWHLLHGPDEAGAYDAQMVALLLTGAAMDSAVFHSVKLAKLAVLAAAKRRPSSNLMARR